MNFLKTLIKIIFQKPKLTSLTPFQRVLWINVHNVEKNQRNKTMINWKIVQKLNKLKNI